MVKDGSLRTRLKNGEIVFGLFYKLNSPAATEILGHLGLDFIIVDCEHSALGYESVEEIIRTADSVGLNAVIRVPNAAEEHIFHALDCGAAGVQIPNLTTVDEVREIVGAAKYYPDGYRGLSMQTRAARYGLWDTSQGSYVKVSNQNSLVVVHIENKNMADAIEEVCQIPQVDVVFFGPADMSQSLGVPGETTNPLVVAAAKRVIECAIKHEKAAGINVTNQAELDMYIAAGARYIVYSSDTAALVKGLRSVTDQFKPYR